MSDVPTLSATLDLCVNCTGVAVVSGVLTPSDTLDSSVGDVVVCDNCTGTVVSDVSEG